MMVLVELDLAGLWQRFFLVLTLIWLLLLREGLKLLRACRVDNVPARLMFCVPPKAAVRLRPIEGVTEVALWRLAVAQHRSRNSERPELDT